MAENFPKYKLTPGIMEYNVSKTKQNNILKNNNPTEIHIWDHYMKQQNVKDKDVRGSLERHEHIP